MTVTKRALDTLEDFHAAELAYDNVDLVGLPFQERLVRYEHLIELYKVWRLWWKDRAVEWESDVEVPGAAADAARQAAKWCRARQDHWASLQRMATRQP